MTEIKFYIEETEYIEIGVTSRSTVFRNEK